MKSPLRATIDCLGNLQDESARGVRKPSLLGEQAWEWDDEWSPLGQLGSYINTNIQSERKSIIELYSTSITLLQKHERPLLPTLAATPKKTLRKRSPKHALDNLAAKNDSIDTGNDRDFIVSNNFPSKLIAKERTRHEAAIKQRSKLETITKEQHAGGKRNSSPTRRDSREFLTSPERVGEQISKLSIRKKLPKLNKRQNREEECASQLNPWEYLQIQEEPAFTVF